MSLKAKQDNAMILAAARSLLAELGEAFTMEQLEAKTNVSRATIYRRIGNKDALLERLAQERGETYEKPDVRMCILRAARVVFGREGLTAFSMEQIASEANVGVATVYRHFGDKESLLRAFVEEMTPFMVVRELTLHPTEDIAADLEKIVRATLDFFHENRDIFRLVFAGSKMERRYLEGLRERSDSTLSRLTAYFQSQMNKGRLKKAGDAGEVALALMGMILAFAVIGPMHYQTRLADMDSSSKLIVSLLLNDLLVG